MNSEDSRNLILAIVLSGLVIFGWNILFPPPKHEPPLPDQYSQNGSPVPLTPLSDRVLPREEALTSAPRIHLDAPGLAGSLNLQGGRIDDVVLKGFRETLKPHSPEVTLFSPDASPNPYWVETGFVAEDKALSLPDKTALWTADRDKLTPTHPVTLRFDNHAGLVFTKTVAVDDQYMFTVTDGVENKSGKPVSLHPFALILRHGTPKLDGTSVHQGFVAYADGAEQRATYTGISKEVDGRKDMHTLGGWFGFTDRYWASAIIPEQAQSLDAHFAVSGPVGHEDYQTDFIAPALIVAPGARAQTSVHVFSGALDVATIDSYVDRLGIPKLDLLVDWGRLYFLTKPMFYLIDFIYKFVGNFGLAILVVTVIVKACFFPLASAGYKSMAKMRLIQPKIAALKEQYPNDLQKQQQANMDLMRQHGINPVAGCLPVLPQIPVFIALYSVFSITLEMRHAPFIGWIHDLSAPDPTNIFNLFGLLPIDPTIIPIFGHFLHIGIWPALMGLTMFLQMKMQPEPSDPTQKMMFVYMPLIFTFMFGSFPAGLVIYYTWNNSLTIVQQSIIMKRAGVKIELFDNLRALFQRKARV